MGWGGGGAGWGGVGIAKDRLVLKILSIQGREGAKTCILSWATTQD